MLVQFQPPRLMETLDLHGVRHAKVDAMVENFVLTEDLPVRVITGNSPTMIRIVQEVCTRHGLREESENHFNLGSRIITDDDLE